jgi:hypothetical protein
MTTSALACSFPPVAQLDVLDHRPFIDTQQRTP